MTIEHDEAWMYDVVVGLQRIEDSHDYQTGCVAHLLAHVPDDVQRIARGIVTYQSAVDRRSYGPCIHRPNSRLTYHTPCADCAHENSTRENSAPTRTSGTKTPGDES